MLPKCQGAKVISASWYWDWTSSDNTSDIYSGFTCLGSLGGTTTSINSLVYLCAAQGAKASNPHRSLCLHGRHFTHRHLRKIDWLMARTACLVCLISTVSGHSKKMKRKKAWRCGASSRHITKLKQSIFFRYLWL